MRRRPGVGPALILLLALAACSEGSGTATTAGDSSTSSTEAENGTSTTRLPTGTTTTTTAPLGVAADLARAVIELGGIPYTVAVADTPENLKRGLMGVEELSPLDGMLFVYDTERVVKHWMKDTLIPLDIAFFNADGFLVSKTSMPTCLDGDCPGYFSKGPARYAVEVPAGGFENLAADARLVVIGDIDGSGKEI